GILWGPIAGFYARKANPPLHVTTLVKETAGPRLIYRVGMGVRPADQNFKRQLNRLIRENQPAINKILLDFGVPVLAENDGQTSVERATRSPCRGGSPVLLSYLRSPRPRSRGLPTPPTPEWTTPAPRCPPRLPAQGC